MRVAVVGSGPAGCAAAIALRRAGADVVLVGDGRDGVGEQLHPAARPLLARLGLDRLSGQLDCVGVRAAWRSDELHDQHFLSHPLGNGWLLDRGRFGETLRRAAVAARAVLREPARLVGVTRTTDATRRWRLELSDGASLACDWLVDATGRRGAVARLLGVKRQRFDRQVALVGWLAADRASDADADADATLTVETTPSGWWYGCRLPGGRRVAGFVTASRPDARVWEAELRATRHLGPLVAGYRVVGTPVVRAADSSLLERCYGPGWIAIGDAAASYDPLASRGLVGALSSGIEAASLVGAPEARLAEWQGKLVARFAAYREERARLYA
jgi:flavin-dependent dehydrogenase